ncbi:hypothetical protein [Pseudomonas putida]|uniref:Uncharacterized protein n=1 Tax=Pseudomonas putida TaxID=303 RepID=A0A8I1E9N1_PSEPU|nr:hypothetical protein [Pseudomonas putida]MBI6882344.1 hypothetical protein [Pseudomonas putida]
MDLDAVIIDSYDQLTSRPGFCPSLSFHPQGERRFGTVIAPYRFTESIACGIESCHTAHLRGYLITTSDGQETGIGGHCGRKHFGLSFTRERKRVDEAIQRKRRIDTVMRAVEQIPAYLATVAELKADYQDLTEIKRRFIDLAGWSTFNELKEMAERGITKIVAYEAMSEAEAEAYFATSNRRPGESREWPEKEVVLANIDGLDFIRSKFTDMLVTNLIKPLESFAERKPSDVEKLTPRALYNEAKWIGRVPGEIEKARGVVKAGRAFFQVENLLKLVHMDVDIQGLSPLLSDLKQREQKHHY